MFELPPSTIDLHLFRYETIVAKGNRDLFHHMILHECDASISFDGPVGHECGEATEFAPENVQRCLGSDIMALWVNFIFYFFKKIILII